MKNSVVFRSIRVLLLLAGLILQAEPCCPLTPEQVVVICNRLVPDSCGLARYYMKRRGIPAQNLIELKAPNREHCGRKEYDTLIAAPVRAFLKNNDPQNTRLHCLVTMYGIPLRVAPPNITPENKELLSGLQKRHDALRQQIKDAEDRPNKKDLKKLKEAEAEVKKEIRTVQKTSWGAAVDSELALVREENYPLDGWLPNKFFLAYRGTKIEGIPQNVILVSRLDASSEAIVRQVIDDSLKTEAEGLTGKAYFDARWPDPGEKHLTGYALYDRAIHNSARIVEKSKRMPVLIDSKQELFGTGQCPNAALYCGWYSLSHYVDAFTWARGAVGYHIASLSFLLNLHFCKKNLKIQ